MKFEDFLYHFERQLPSIALKIITIGLLIFVSVNISMATGKPDSYYMRLNPGLATTYCVYADINWRPDDVIYCAEDMSKVLLFNLALNAQIQQNTLLAPTIIQKDPKGIV